MRLCVDYAPDWFEQNDFAFGTSGRSSRLLHGGMRYLAQGRLKMVRDASVEKRSFIRLRRTWLRHCRFYFQLSKKIVTGSCGS